MCPQHLPEKVVEIVCMVQGLIYPFNGEVLFHVELLDVSEKGLQFDLQFLQSGSILSNDNPAGYRVSTGLLVIGNRSLKQVLDLRDSEWRNSHIFWWIDGYTLLRAR